MPDVEFATFSTKVNLIAALDPSSRAGNYFFQSIFDQHPEVLTCPWIQYSYSYFVTKFGLEDNVDSREALHYWTEVSYFKLVYQAREKVAATITSFGADPAAPIDREKVCEVFDRLALANSKISRRDVITASFYAYAVGANRDLNAIRYILVSDAVSLRSESPLQGFSGKIVTAMQRDFPNFKLVFLERDPRATFASCKQQYTNSYGNIYNVKPATFFPRLFEFFRLDFHTESCVWLYWLVYAAGAARIASHLKEHFKRHAMVVKNEDLNLEFDRTMRLLSQTLGISFLTAWENSPFEPTNAGRRWLGKGAFNSRYQKNALPVLANDPDDVAQKITGPNAYVTERWKKRLSRAEIGVIEYLFQGQIDALGYPYIVNARKKWIFLWSLSRPFSGEIPDLGWLTRSLRLGTATAANCIMYYLTLPLFYVIARLTLLYVVYGKRLFFTEKLPGNDGPKSAAL